jgi:23S rRNA (uracil1939-C5)-methyltransferase
VRVRPGGKRGDGQAAVLEQVLDPSPDRVAPPAPIRTGLRRLRGAALGAGRAGRLEARKAGRGAVPRRLCRCAGGETIATEAGHRRRADLALRRTQRGVVAGLHVAGSAEVLDLASCAVLDPRLLAPLPALRAMLARLSALKREGSAVANLLDTGPDLLLRTDGPLSADDRVLLARFAEEHAIPRIAWARGTGAAEVAAQHAPATIALSGAIVAPPPGAFLQASPAGEAAIIAAVLAALPAS